MDEAGLFSELSELLARAGIEIRVEPFKTPSESAGGICSVFGKPVVLLDKNASRAEWTRALLEAVETQGLEALGVSGRDLSPGLLSHLNRRGQMAWPHKRDAPSLAKTDARTQRKIRLVPPVPPHPIPSSLGSQQGLPESQQELPEESVPRLRSLTTLELGGPPETFHSATTQQQVMSVAREARDSKTPLYVLGGGSNLVVADRGVRGTVLSIRTQGIEVERRGRRASVRVQAGENWHAFVRNMTDLGFSGLECLAGIPGCVGATPIQNVGAYGQQVDTTISSVKVLNRQTLEISDFTNEQCEFSYRSSVFKTRFKDQFIVLSVTFDLEIDGAPTIAYGELRKQFEAGGNHLEGENPREIRVPQGISLRAVFDQVLALRKNKSMLLDAQDENRRSCGSFFVNAIVSESQAERISEIAGERVPTFPVDPQRSGHREATVKVPSAWLIERAGLSKGHRMGAVGLSSRHTLCVVAHEGASSSELVAFARYVRRVVEEKFLVRLIPEPNFWGFDELEDGLPR